MMASSPSIQERRRQVAAQGYLDAGLAMPSHLEVDVSKGTVSWDSPPPSSQPDKSKGKSNKSKKNKKKKKGSKGKGKRRSYGNATKAGDEAVASAKAETAGPSLDDRNTHQSSEPTTTLQDLKRFVTENYQSSPSGGTSPSLASTPLDNNHLSFANLDNNTAFNTAYNTAPKNIVRGPTSLLSGLFKSNSSPVKGLANLNSVLPEASRGTSVVSRTRRVLFPSGTPKSTGKSVKVAPSTSNTSINRLTSSEAIPMTPGRMNRSTPFPIPSSEILQTKLLHAQSKMSGEKEKPDYDTPTKPRRRSKLGATTLSRVLTNNKEQSFGQASLFGREGHNMGEFERTMVKFLSSPSANGPLLPMIASADVPGNFGMILEQKGVSGLATTAPDNAKAIVMALLTPRGDDEPTTQAEYEAYVKSIMSSPNSVTAKIHFVNHLLDLSNSICATAFDVKFNHNAESDGMLSMAMPFPAPGMLQGILTADFHKYVNENVRKAAGPAASPCQGVSLAHVVGDWKEQTESNEMLELRHFYHGAILVEGHDSAVRCSGIKEQHEPSVLGFTTNGLELKIYMHFSAAATGDNAAGYRGTEYLAFHLKTVRLVQSLAEFSMGRTMIRNLQAWGGRRSQNLRDLLAGVNASHMLRSSMVGMLADAQPGASSAAKTSVGKMKKAKQGGEKQKKKRKEKKRVFEDEESMHDYTPTLKRKKRAMSDASHSSWIFTHDVPK